MPLQLDQKFSTFANGGTVVIGDIIVGLRAGINTKFTFDAGVTTLQGTLNQVLVNNSVGVPVAGPVVLSTPQDIATTSSPTFDALTLTTASAFRLVAGGITSGNPLQSVVAGTAGQLLQSNGASALPTWTAAAFPVGPGTLNHLLRSDGTNWVETTATTITSADVMSGLTQLNVDNLRLDGNTLSSTDSSGFINIIPEGSGASQGTVNIGIEVASIPFSSSPIQIAAVAKAAAIDVTTYWNANAGSGLYLSTSRSEVPGVLGAVTNPQIIAQIVAEGDDGVTGLVAGAQIIARTSGAISSGVIPAQWEFYTVNTSGVRTIGMTLTNAQALVLANPLLVASGGSGRASNTAYALIAGGTTSTGIQQSLSTGTAGQFLTSGGAAALPTWTTATFPGSAGTAGTILRSNGTNFVNSTSTFADTYTASNLLYSNGANTVTGLATAANGLLVTDASGVPSIGNTISGALTVTGAITPSQTNGIVGTTTNNNANAGSVGEVISSQVLFASSISMTAGVALNVTSIALTAGDWTVYGNVDFLGGVSTVVNYLNSAISTVSATLPDPSLYSIVNYQPPVVLYTTQVDVAFTVPTRRISLSAPATVYLVAVAAFTTSTNNVCGQIFARRER